jgi:glycosyltransferase involved in cell wall biosynthesis
MSARLLYVGDVLPLKTGAGELLLYRLFEGYPPDRLLVLGPVAGGGSRLPGVHYVPLRLAWRRLLTTRMVSLVVRGSIIRCLLPVRAIDRAVREFSPEVIVTVLHDVGWLAAWRAARWHGLPLAMIVHDDRLTFCDRIRGSLRGWARGLVGGAYRGARVRFCISPEMRDAYRERYGADGEVLYPSLAAGTISVEGARENRRGEGERSLTFFYAGSVRSHGVKRQLGILGAIAARRGHRVVVLSPDADDLRQSGMLHSGAVAIRDAVPSDEARAAMAAEADVLVVGIDANTGDNARFLFPTKLAEYTSLGRPILLCSPRGTAAANWAQGPPVRALWVEDPVREEDLAAAVRRLEEDAALRQALGAAALREARERFSHEAVFGVFMKGISGVLGTGC